jgi:hypothetical protein
MHGLLLRCVSSAPGINARKTLQPISPYRRNSGLADSLVFESVGSIPFLNAAIVFVMLGQRLSNLV